MPRLSKSQHEKQNDNNRYVIAGNLEKLHHRCDEFVKGLKFIVPTVLLAFACYALQIVLQIL